MHQARRKKIQIQEENRFGLAQSAIQRPTGKEIDIISINLYYPEPDSFWRLKYKKGDRVWDIDAPYFMRRTPENLYRFFFGSALSSHFYLKESQVGKEGHTTYVVVDDILCEKPKIIIKYKSKDPDVIYFDDFSEAEKKFKELFRKFRLMFNPV